jgi:ABC-type transport system substrate-binding protein
MLADLKRRAKGIDVLEAVQLHTRMLVFDCERPPLSDRRVRQAINYAIDRARFVQDVHGGMAEPARGPIPPGLAGYDAAERGYYHDPRRARLLLEEAGYGDGFDTEIWWLQSVNPAVGSICDDLAAVGIRAAVRYVVPAEMEQGLSLRMVPIAGRDWYANYPDSDNFTYVLFKSANRDLFNATYSDPETDRLTERARVVMNVEERAAMYREVVRTLLEGAPCAFLAHRRSFVAYRSDLEGMTLRLLSPFVMPKNLWFAR